VVSWIFCEKYIHLKIVHNLFTCCDEAFLLRRLMVLSSSFECSRLGGSSKNGEDMLPWCWIRWWPNHGCHRAEVP
jgi:hypothetical protein